MARATAIQVYSQLPKKNCRECGENTCMAYAISLVEGKKKADECAALTKEQKKSIAVLLAPRVALVEIGAGEKAISIGGEEVMYRHELRFMNPPPVFIDISDLMDKEEIKRRIDYVKHFEIERLGQKLSVDGIALRCASGRPERFKNLAEAVCANYSGPLALCSFDDDVLTAGMEIAGSSKPLIYAADEENWKEALKLAKKYDSPLVLYSSDLSQLGRIAKDVAASGHKKIVLDPGMKAGSGAGDTLNKYAMLRKAAMDEALEFGYPLLASTASVWAEPRCENEQGRCAYMESTYASALIMRYASILIMQTIEPWAILSVLTLRHGIYTDPRVEPTVEPKLYAIGAPNQDSPVFLTTNFALTYYSVSKDLEDAGVSCFLLVADTDGLAASVAVAADKLTPAGIKDALQKYSVGERVKHRILVIPGVAAGLKDAIEKETGWKAVTGPQDSSQIAGFLKENREKIIHG